MKILDKYMSYNISYFEEFDIVQLCDGKKVIAVTAINLIADDKVWALPDMSPLFGELWRVLARDVETKCLDAKMYLLAPYGKEYDINTWAKRLNGNSKVTTNNKTKNEFPHHCTRCGRESYNGLFEVAHKDETVAMSCPARRK